MAGLTDYGEAQALNAILPNGTARYVALFTVSPDEDGTGGTEASGNGYARKSHSAWIDEEVDGVTYRKNDGAIEFDALSGSVSGIVAWGVYDASTAGNLLAFGPLRDSNGDAVTKNFVNTDQPRFIDQELQIGVGG